MSNHNPGKEEIATSEEKEQEKHVNIYGDDLPERWPEVSSISLVEGTVMELSSLPPVRVLRIYDYRQLRRLPILPATIEVLSLWELPALTELPSLPHVKGFTINTCGLRQLPAFSDKLESLSVLFSRHIVEVTLAPYLQRLYLDGIPVTQLPPFPASLRIITLRHCPRLAPITEWPEALERLIIMRCRHMPYPQILPQGLQVFEYIESGPSLVSTLPPGLTALGLSQCQALPRWNELPHLCKLSLTHTPLLQDDNITLVPPTLTTLKLSHCVNITRLDNLPPQLQRLSVVDLPGLSHLNNLSASLKELRIDDCTLHSLSLPPGLTYFMGLNISVQQPFSLPGQLEKLIFHGCQLPEKRIDPPETVRCIIFTRTDIELVKIPQALEDLSCEFTCTELPNMGRAKGLNRFVISECAHLQRLPYIPPTVQKFQIKECPLLPDFTWAQFQRLQEIVQRLNHIRLRRLFYPAFLRWRARRWADVHVDITHKPGVGAEWEKMKEGVSTLSGLKLEP